MASPGVLTAAVKKLQPSRYELAPPCVYQEVTNVVPTNQPPIARYAQGSRSSPDPPINTKRSRFNQSSRTSNHPLCGALPTAIVMRNRFLASGYAVTVTKIESNVGKYLYI